MAGSCLFCQIALAATSTRLLYADEKVVAFPDINPSASRHYLVIPIQHVPTVNDLKRRPEDHHLVNHMLNVGKDLLQKDAPECNLYSTRRNCFTTTNITFGYDLVFINLHLTASIIFIFTVLHYLTNRGPLGFIEAEKLLEKIKPLEVIE